MYMANTVTCTQKIKAAVAFKINILLILSGEMRRRPGGRESGRNVSLRFFKNKKKNVQY